MVNLREGLVDAVGQGLCNTTSLAASLGQLGSNLWRSAGADGIANAGQDLADGFGAAADIFCNREPRAASDSYPPLFTGGQCEGTEYNVQINFIGTLNGNPFPNSSNTDVWGPITFEGIEEGIPGGAENNRWVAVFSGGKIPDGQPGAGTRDGWRPILTPGDLQDPMPSITGITTTPLAGGPDDCGNPPPAPPGYDPADFSPTLPVSYDDNSGNPQNINVPVVYGPGSVNNNNQFTVPITLDLGPGIQINGDINLSTGGISIGGGGSDAAPREIPEDEPTPEGSALVGIRILFTEASAQRTGATERLGSGSSVPIWLPRLAAVRFEYESNGTRGWGPSKFAQTLDSVIWAERPATDFNVTVERTDEYEVRKIVMNPDLFFNGGTGPGN